jgi:hypothetical protein
MKHSGAEKAGNVVAKGPRWIRYPVMPSIRRITSATGHASWPGRSNQLVAVPISSDSMSTSGNPSNVSKRWTTLAMRCSWR